ncbi:copper chaperone PCu(A)C [Zhongshania aliphaticivorans]|uniref:copper chaperone PCu(A)C n=1 Tax=Zhongshania aliphaticivorans TaxID=1470434 RepID=UPI0039C98C18
MSCKWMSVGGLAALLFSAVLQAQPDQITVENAYVRGLPPSQRNTAAFFSVQNPRGQEVRIVAGDSDAAERLEIHGHQHRNGMMSMQREDAVTVPAKGEFVFAPGAYHLMLINLTRPLADGDRVKFTLKTAEGEVLAIDAPVISVLKPAPSANTTSSSTMSPTEHTGMH